MAGTDVTIGIRVWPGPYKYRILSGRIKVGRRVLQKGDYAYLSAKLAKSLYPTGQIEFICVAFGFRRKRSRRVLPGEQFSEMSENSLKELIIKDLKKFAREEYGITGLKTHEPIIMKILKTRRMAKCTQA